MRYTEITGIGYNPVELESSAMRIQSFLQGKERVPENDRQQMLKDLCIACPWATQRVEELYRLFTPNAKVTVEETSPDDRRSLETKKAGWMTEKMLTFHIYVDNGPNNMISVKFYFCNPGLAEFPHYYEWRGESYSSGPAIKN